MASTPGDGANIGARAGGLLPTLGLAALVGVVASFGVVSRETRVESESAAWPAALVGGAAGAVVVIGLTRWSRTRATIAKLGLATTAIVGIALGALVGIATSTKTTGRRDVVTDLTAEVEGVPERELEGPAFPPVDSLRPIFDRRLTDLEGSLVLLAGLLGLVAVGVLFARRSELRAVEYSAVYLASDLTLEPDDSDDDDMDPDVLATALEVALRQLETESDPRVAIRVAYGTLLVELDQAGFPKWPYEAPAEFVARCLGASRLAASDVEELLHLFQLARFSDHAVTPSHAAAAQRALRRCRERVHDTKWRTK